MLSTVLVCGGYKEGSRKLQGKCPGRRALSHDIQTMGLVGVKELLCCLSNDQYSLLFTQCLPATAGCTNGSYLLFFYPKVTIITIHIVLYCCWSHQCGSPEQLRTMTPRAVLFLNLFNDACFVM
jgi:hypothetical protein